MHLWSFDLKPPTNRGKKGVHGQHSCPSDFLPRIRKCPRLLAGNWVFQGRRLNSSSWLCWGRECRWFSSSLFLGRGCKNEQNVPMVATVCHSDQSLMRRRGTKPERESCELLLPTNQSLIAQISWRTLISAPLSFHALRWIDGSENDWCYGCTLLIYLEKHHAWMSLQLISQVHTHTRTGKLGLTFPGRSTQVSLQIPLLLELTLESELLFWAHIHPLLLQRGTTDKMHVLTEVLMHMKVKRCCRNHRVSPHNWVQLLYQIEKKEWNQSNCFWLFPATSQQELISAFDRGSAQPWKMSYLALDYWKRIPTHKLFPPCRLGKGWWHY